MSQPFCMLSMIFGEKSLIDDAPRGSASSAARTLRASASSSKPKAVRIAAKSFCGSCNST